VIQFLAWEKNILSGAFFSSVQAGSLAYPGPYSLFTGVSFGIEWLGHEANYSPSSSVEVKNDLLDK
jgi:hypothetical protein